MKTSIALLVVIVVAAAAALMVYRPEQESQSATTTVATVPFTPLADGQRSKITSRVNYLITTQQELADLWKFLDEPPPVPTVDFTSKVVVAVFAGEVPTTGYDIAVAAVEDANRRIVQVQITKPDDSCVLAQSTSAPYQVVELAKTSLPFTHADILTPKVCQ